MYRKTRPGFTLVELLVVLAIIGILVSLLLPAVVAARGAARRMQCGNHLKQIGLALHNYHDTYEKFPPGTIHGNYRGWNSPYRGTARLEFGWGWSVFTLPFLEQESIYEQFDLRSTRWPHGGAYAENKNVLVPKAVIGTYICPAASGKEVLRFGTRQNGKDILWAKTNYLGVADSRDRWWNPSEITYQGDGVLFNHSSIRFSDVRDGTSHTLMVGEGVSMEPAPNGFNRAWTWAVHNLADMRTGINGPGTPPGDRTCLPTGIPPGPGFASRHPGGAQFLSVDGSVDFLSETTEHAVLEAKATRAKREIAGS